MSRRMNCIIDTLPGVILLIFLSGERVAEGAEPVTVFRSKSEGYNVYRIPAMIRAANGDLLAFCEAREGGDASEIDLVMKRSADQGATWGKLQVVQESDRFQDLYPGEAITVGNPAPVVDLLDPEHPGRIWLPFTLENDRVFVTSSDDHGSSWSEPQEITKEVKLDAWGWYATGPVHSIQLRHPPHRGRLLIPCDHRLGDDGADRGPNGVHVVYSDDHGTTWQLGAIDDTYDDALNSNETAAVELSDGTIYFNTRDQNGDAAGTRGVAFSRDGGESYVAADDERHKWFVPANVILDPPVVQCSLLRVELMRESDKSGLILFCGPDDNGPTGKGRSDLRIRYSTNETKTWHDGPLLHEGPAAYSDMVTTTAGGEDVAVLYEAGDVGGSAYQRIDFQKISIDELNLE